MRKFTHILSALIFSFGFGSVAYAQSVRLNAPIPQGGGSTLIETNDIAPYFSAIFTFGTGIIISLSIVMIMIAGVKWLTAGDSGRINEAKSDIITYIAGLLLAIFSYYILFIINPSLTILKSPNVGSTNISGYEGFDVGASFKLNNGADCTDLSQCDSGICWEYADGTKDGKGKCIEAVGYNGICEDANIAADTASAAAASTFLPGPFATLGALISGYQSANPDAPCIEGLICYDPLLNAGTGTCRVPE